MTSPRLPILLTLFAGAAIPAIGADISFEERRSTKAVAGQCQSYLNRPVTNELLPEMHDAGCCDVLVNMYETEAVNALERRLMCPAWHHYKMLYDGPAEDFEDLADVDVPPELADIVIPPGDNTTPDQPQPPLPLPQAPVQQAPAQQPASVPWTMMTSPAEFPEGVAWPEGYVPGPLNFGNQ